MREHPIPQDITNYRFHIVGSMTLKQFGEVGGGLLLAFIVYKIGLPQYIGIPIALLIAITGAAAAFVPFEQRPLDHWIVTFVKVLYKPTQFYWKRTPFIPPVFSYASTHPTTPLEPEVDLTPARRTRIKEFISSLNHEPATHTSVSTEEQQRIDSILNTFAELPTGQGVEQADKPNLKIRPRKLRKLGGPAPAAIDVVPQVQPQQPPDTVEIAVPHTTTVEVVDTTQAVEEHITEDQPIIAAEESTVEQQLAALEPVMDTQVVATTTQAEEAAFNVDLPFPDPPDEPNKIVGMVMTPNNELLSGAIVEIATSAGHIARAVKTNALGQFFVTTPLPSGEYVLQVENDGYMFEPIRLSLNNTVVDPIEIRSV